MSGEHDELSTDEQGELPSEFWAAPPEVFTEPGDQLLFSELLGRMRREVEEAIGSSTIDYMRAERVAFLYCYIRLKERKKTFAHDRAYKETLQLWQGLANDHQKSTRTAFDPEEFRAGILYQVSRALEDAVQVLPEDQQQQFLDIVISRLEIG